MKNEDTVRQLREAWGTLHNLSVDMEAGPVRQQMQKRAANIRVYLDSIEDVNGQYDKEVEAYQLKDHEVAQLVNRLTEVAKKFHNTQQLRERIAHEIRPLFVKGSEESNTVELDGIKNSTYEPSDHLIRKVFMECGFTIKDGQSDLKPYVFLAARKLIEAGLKEVMEAGNIQLSEKEIREEWKKAGGSIHGPRVETVTMPEQTYFAFRRAMGAPTLHQLASNQLSGNPGELTGDIKKENDEAFEAWWESHGQFCRAGGGDYEKTFAYAAWNAAQARESGQ